jgi:hypothetical protein
MIAETFYFYYSPVFKWVEGLAISFDQELMAALQYMLEREIASHYLVLALPFMVMVGLLSWDIIPMA